MLHIYVICAFIKDASRPISELLKILKLSINKKPHLVVHEPKLCYLNKECSSPVVKEQYKKSKRFGALSAEAGDIHVIFTKVNTEPLRFKPLECYSCNTGSTFNRNLSE